MLASFQVLSAHVTSAMDISRGFTDSDTAPSRFRSRHTLDFVTVAGKFKGILCPILCEFE